MEVFSRRTSKRASARARDVYRRASKHNPRKPPPQTKPTPMDRKKAQKSLALSRKDGRESKESFNDELMVEQPSDAQSPYYDSDDDGPVREPNDDDDEPGPNHIQTSINDRYENPTLWEDEERKRISEKLYRVRKSFISNKREAENLADEEKELNWRLYLLDISTHRRWDIED